MNYIAPVINWRCVCKCVSLNARGLIRNDKYARSGSQKAWDTHISCDFYQVVYSACGLSIKGHSSWSNICLVYDHRSTEIPSDGSADGYTQSQTIRSQTHTHTHSIYPPYVVYFGTRTHCRAHLAVLSCVRDTMEFA